MSHMYSLYRPTVARIDLDAFARNIQVTQRHSNRKIMGVIKADAYGHGATACARVLESCGAAYAGVALAEEALALRAAGIGLPLLVLGKTPPSAMPALVHEDIACTVTGAGDAEALQAAARVTGKRPRAHVKLDTGMNRLGIPAEEAGDFWEMLRTCDQLDIEGVFTHFAAADAEDLTSARKQTAMFDAALALLEDRGCRPLLAHACASSGLHTMPQSLYDMVRPGICLYGGVQPFCTAFSTEPVMRLESRLAAMHWVEPGSAVSYGNTYTCLSRRRVAVVQIGYADGLPRGLSNRGVMLTHGRLAPIVGRICMDMTMIDITDIPEATEGSPVIVFGNPVLDGPDCPTVNQIADSLDTIPYEVLCGISKRVPRVYTRPDKASTPRVRPKP